MNNQVTPIKQEHKTVHLDVKSVDQKGMFEGYGSIFGNEDSYGEVVVPGAFDKSLESAKPSSVKLLWQHDSTEPIGVYLDIHEDKKGLYVKGQLLIDDIARAREAYALLKVGAINGLSIGYTVNPGGFEFRDGVKVLTSLDLWEVSVVTFPANERALVANVKHAHKDIKDIRDFENFLRDAGGFSRADAVAIANHGYKGLQRDAEAQSDISKDILMIMTALENGVKSI